MITRNTRFKLELAGIGFVVFLILLMLMLWAPNPPHLPSRINPGVYQVLFP
jgi:hypothetical protein